MENLQDAAIPAGSLFNQLSPLPKDAAVTMAYIPFQTDKSRFDEEEALRKGTLFCDLNKPFLRGAIK